MASRHTTPTTDITLNEPFQVITEYDNSTIPAIFDAEQISDDEYSWTVTNWSFSTSSVKLADGSMVSVSEVAE